MFDKFIKGELAINCETEEEAVELFIFLKSKGILWGLDYRDHVEHNALNYICWNDYKSSAYYMYSTYRKGLMVWKNSYSRESIKFSEISKEDLIVIEDINTIDNTLKSLTNNHAIICRSKAEAIELFEWLGNNNIKQSTSCGYCSKYNTGWYYRDSSRGYVILNNKSTDYGVSEEQLKRLKFNLIEYSDFKIDNNI